MFQIESSICGECGGCVAVCPTGALELHSDGLKIKSSLCTACENCIIFCPIGALQTDDGPSQAHLSSKTAASHPENEKI
jgi:Fe-S-cluster-containing hydrogenase component 2